MMRLNEEQAAHVLSMSPLFHGMKRPVKLMAIKAMAPEERLRLIKSMNITPKMKFSLILSLDYETDPEATMPIGRQSVELHGRKNALLMGRESALRREIRSLGLDAGQAEAWHSLRDGTPKKDVVNKWVDTLAGKGKTRIERGAHQGEMVSLLIPKLAERMEALVKKHSEFSRVH